jgi:hypothetical protein
MKMNLSARCLLLLALLPAGCGEPRIGRERAIAIAEAYVAKGGEPNMYPKHRRVAYERRSTWLVKFMIQPGGTGGPPTLEIDKRTGEVLMFYAFQ